MVAKSITTMRQVLRYQPHQTAWFAATQTLFNQVVAFYFEVIQAHERVLDLNNKDALTALEMLTHTAQKNPTPIMPLEEIREDLPALFRRAAINAALGSARSFFSHLQKWRKRKEKALAKGKTFTKRPPVPPRTWNKPVPFYAGQWKERTPSSILLKVWTGKRIAIFSSSKAWRAERAWHRSRAKASDGNAFPIYSSPTTVAAWVGVTLHVSGNRLHRSGRSCRVSTQRSVTTNPAQLHLFYWAIK